LAEQRVAIIAAYEVLRAFALGDRQDAHLPAGFDLLFRSGLPTWLATWVSSPPVVHESVPALDLPAVVSALRPELILVLATMALRRRGEDQP